MLVIKQFQLLQWVLPPPTRHHPCNCIIIKPFSDASGRIASHYFIIAHGLRNHGIPGNDGTGTDRNAGEYDCTISNPDIIPD
jgi:hypothetical protein